MKQLIFGGFVAVIAEVAFVGVEVVKAIKGGGYATAEITALLFILAGLIISIYGLLKKENKHE